MSDDAGNKQNNKGTGRRRGKQPSKAAGNDIAGGESKERATGDAKKPANRNNNRGRGKGGRGGQKKVVPVEDQGEGMEQKQPARDKDKNHDKRKQQRRRNKTQSDSFVYPKHLPLHDCLQRYNAKEPDIIRGTLRVMSGKDGMSFCTCDRGSQKRDVVIESP
eukprot:CAMPEP_0117000412 /NCGR_PEP_ID=MMETSP0472-20121206/2761_1 /TAXON_ID=693140 ORGANISM="Tiarina fusus, Strain LIS" /NCGR_SAMPLE_ID=MMETSP0472 /ASSEMBLY_ACC=CAM_ASM_000603 /LENGTH=161 /DNA_ID=CAMNT_0004700093 /DNA_START=208 /DNA_END=689 /DNA_ORIENTATION=+